MSMMEEKMANREATDASIPVQQVMAATTAGTSTSTSATTAGTSTSTSANGHSMAQLEQVVVPTVAACKEVNT